VTKEFSTWIFETASYEKLHYIYIILHYITIYFHIFIFGGTIWYDSRLLSGNFRHVQSDVFYYTHKTS